MTFLSLNGQKAAYLDAFALCESHLSKEFQNNYLITSKMHIAR